MMSVSRGGTAPEVSHDDLEKQRVAIESEYDPGGADPAADMTLLFEDLSTFEPAGGLDRGELAELYGYKIKHRIWNREAPATGLSQFICSWEISEDSHANYPGILTNSLAGTVSFEGTSVDGDVTDFDTRTGSPDAAEVNEDVVAWVANAAYSGAYDTSTSAGAGGQMGQVVQDEGFYRQQGMSHGPVYDRHSDFHVHALGSILNNNHQWRDTFTAELLWNVYEE